MGLLLILALACCALASERLVAKYDNIPSSFVGLFPVPDYEYLHYTNWDLSGGGPAGVEIGGVAPKSPPNLSMPTSSKGNPSHLSHLVIITALLADAATVFPLNPYNSIALGSFYFGCGTRTGTAIANVALNCTIKVSGTTNGVLVDSIMFTFTTPLSPITPAPMTKAVLPQDFGRFTNVTFAITGEVPVDTALLIDNFLYYLHE